MMGVMGTYSTFTTTLSINNNNYYDIIDGETVVYWHLQRGLTSKLTIGSRCKNNTHAIMSN